MRRRKIRFHERGIPKEEDKYFLRVCSPTRFRKYQLKGLSLFDIDNFDVKLINSCGAIPRFM